MSATPAAAAPVCSAYTSAGKPCSRPAKFRMAEAGHDPLCGVHARSHETWGGGAEPIDPDPDPDTRSARP